MASELKTCEKMALGLPLRQRARLVEHLLASIDQPRESENEELWAEEAHRRYVGYKNGRISARPAADAIRDARRKIQ
jgi:putative addiction module component (TIGR02574 family)